LSAGIASKFYQLEELEDREACTTEIFLSNDGSVTATETNGPPHIDVTGKWSQSNDTSFTMTVKRTYGTGNDSSDIGEFQFDVERSFIGEITLVGGVTSITGSMHMNDEFSGDVEVGFFSMIDTTASKLGEEELKWNNVYMYDSVGLDDYQSSTAQTNIK